MIRHLTLNGVGPAETLDIALAPRLNVLTGDNGLGKTFLLDIAWWALTRFWAAELNKQLPGGHVVRPRPDKDASILFTVGTGQEDRTQTVPFDRRSQDWGRLAEPMTSRGLVLYAMADGSFAVWDPTRNGWGGRRREEAGGARRVPAYVFSPTEVWEGLRDDEHRPLCNGLILDWGTWQNRRNSTAFERLCRALESLSASETEKLSPGELTRVAIDDPRDIPTIKMPYGDEVPVTQASAGVRRVLAFAYLLVWAWEEHLTACAFLGEQPTSEIVFLIDEVEAHLHPRWQRAIVRSLLSVVGSIEPYTRAVVEDPAQPATALPSGPYRAHVQMVLTTHAPLVMASLEPHFDADTDAWYDLDLVQGEVELTQRPFVRRGDACQWLMSEAFDLGQARSTEAESALQEAAVALSNEHLDRQHAQVIEDRLRQVLGETDPFWARWRFVSQKRGWS